MYVYFLCFDFGVKGGWGARDFQVECVLLGEGLGRNGGEGYGWGGGGEGKLNCDGC